MYHSRWKGSHYEAGLHYGNILHKNGVNPMSSIPISDERKEFSVKCLPIYEKFYPEIVEEIKGMANGLKIGYMDIASFIFTMYCFVFDNKCSCLAISNKGKTLFARNSDFVVSIENYVIVHIINLTMCIHLLAIQLHGQKWKTASMNIN